MPGGIGEGFIALLPTDPSGLKKGEHFMSIETRNFKLWDFEERKVIELTFKAIGISKKEKL